MITVRVTPRGGRDAIDGWSDDGTLRVRVSAAPAGGKANDAVVRLLARALNVPPSSVSIVRGTASRIKQVSLNGLPSAAIRERLS
jgi:uncharacterized protein (TIGR00251 family)